MTAFKIKCKLFITAFKGPTWLGCCSSFQPHLTIISPCSQGSSHTDLINPPALWFTPASRPPPCCSFCQECSSPGHCRTGSIAWLVLGVTVTLHRAFRPGSITLILLILFFYCTFSISFFLIIICLTPSRMFAPWEQVPGFPVCGSLFCLHYLDSSWYMVDFQLTFMVLQENHASLPFKSFHGSTLSSEWRTHFLAYQWTISTVLLESTCKTTFT